MTQNEFDAIKRNMITLGTQIKNTGEIPKPFDRKNYYDSEKQRVFITGVSYGLNIALNILTYVFDSTRDDMWNAESPKIIDELSPERMTEALFADDEAMKKICSWRKNRIGGCPFRGHASDDDCKNCVKKYLEYGGNHAKDYLAKKIFFGGEG